MTANRIVVESQLRAPVEQQQFELVERKGKGHPDSICDAIAEEVSLALCREYQASFGRILHHNTDKAMLVAGRSEPRVGGGRVVDPMRLVLGDRAVSQYRGKSIDVDAIAESSAHRWLQNNLRFVDPDQHLVFQSELKQGSPELTDLFERDVVGANDTSAAVGFAPLSETERLVLAAERWMNSEEFKQRFPEAGEDIKVMGLRTNGALMLTVAVAFVDRYVLNAASYFQRKEQMQVALTDHLSPSLRSLDRVSVQLNTLDDADRGADGMYLTVLGTSAEGADCGQVGRGNRVNGVISLNRPISTEAAAGKNPVSHVGKIYSLLTNHIAQHIVEAAPGLAEVYVWLCSQIGKPINAPAIAAVHVILRDGVGLPDVQPTIESILERELADTHNFCQRLARGEFPVW